MRPNLVWIVLSLMPACASVPSMSADEHDQAAASERATAQRERAQYDPTATEQTTRCASYGAGTDMLSGDVPACWHEETNPTDPHLAEARRHERIAASHVTASKRLRDSEEAACVGVSEPDRHASPFSHQKDILSLSFDADASGKPLGVTYVFAPIPGLNAAGFKRLLDCHLAIDAELGNDVAERDDCPLVPRGVRAEVVPTGQGFRVILRADSNAATEEMVRRAQRLQHSGAMPPLSSR